MNPSPESSGKEWTWKGTLRGLLWRLQLGVLPSSAPTITEIRRAVADGRRRYAELRRRLLVDPHAVEDAYKPQQYNVDNPLSQDPESVWSRYFQIAELEETIDTDLTRLYPEHGDLFQSPACQAMLRRILLVWSLMHSNYSYRQGMHELLAPLLYVLHSDIVHLAEVKKRHEDLFDDRFEEPFYLESKTPESGGKQMAQRLPCSKTVATVKGSDVHVDVAILERVAARDSACLKDDELNCVLRIMVLGNDTYGAEGELGVILSGRFVEHDAYSMFNALMSCKSGGVNMADYFMANSGLNSTSGLPPAIEDSSLLYRALSVVDLPLYNHLKGLGVEPQFFALRWIRVLFCREFDLQKLLVLWDAIFSLQENSNELNHSPRRDFILAISLSMILYLRLTLLASPNSTDCLKKLLSFPQSAEIGTLIECANMLKPLVEEVASMIHSGRKPYESPIARTTSQVVNKSPTSFSPEILRKPFPDFYWEEKWKNSVLHKEMLRNHEEKMRKAQSGTSQLNSNNSTNSSLSSFLEVPDGALQDMLEQNLKEHEGLSEIKLLKFLSVPSEVENHTKQNTPTRTQSCGITSKTLESSQTNDPSPEEKKFNIPATPKSKSSSHPRKYWIWNLGRGKNQEKKGVEQIIIQPKDTEESSSLGEKATVLQDGHNKNCIANKFEDKMACNSSSFQKDDYKVSAGSGFLSTDPNDLRKLGLSIYDNIRVIEAAFTGKTPVEDSVVDIGGSGFKTAHLWDQENIQAALAELKEISNKLQHM